MYGFILFFIEVLFFFFCKLLALLHYLPYIMTFL